MSPPGIYDTPRWGEILESSVTMTQVSGATVTELTELSDIGVVATEIPDNVDDYNLSAVGMWDWVFALVTWNNLGNTWSGGWEIPEHIQESQ